MGRLTYVTNASLDGFIEDEQGDFAWAPPDDGVFAALTDVVRATGTFLYGRRLYETMAVWETDPSLAARSDLTAAFATAWQAADKVVHSTTLTEAPTARTTIERQFDPEAVRRLKASTDADLTIGGADLAAQAFRAGLVDELLLVSWPLLIGGGKPALPSGLRLALELVDEQRFASGALLLRYRTAA